MKNKSWNKETFALIVIFLLGIIGLFVGSNCPSKSGFFISIGSSLITSVITRFLLKRADIDDKNLNTISEIKTMLSKNEKMVISNLENIKYKIDKNLVDTRVLEGKRHLRDIFDDMLQQEQNNLSSTDMLYIDVMGLELYNFYNDQFEKIKNISNLRLRLIVQDPYSKHFDNMIKNEHLSLEDVKKNIEQITGDIYRLNLENCEIRWAYFPCSVSITRINNQLYVRSRLSNSIHKEELSYFIKYVGGELPFKTYTDYFNEVWKQWDDQKSDFGCEAKQHYLNYVGDIINDKKN